MEIPFEGPFSDLMWSDPADVSTWTMSPRGAGWFFGENETQEFEELNNLSLIVRAHQLVSTGHMEWHKKRLITIWSAPNYCYRCGNKASIMKIDKSLNFEFETYEACPRNSKSKDYKYILPYFL